MLVSKPIANKIKLTDRHNNEQLRKDSASNTIIVHIQLRDLATSDDLNKSLSAVVVDLVILKEDLFDGLAAPNEIAHHYASLGSHTIF